MKILLVYIVLWSSVTSLNIEVTEDLLVNSRDCNALLLQIKERLNVTYQLFWNSVEGRLNLPERVNLILPENSCPRLSLTTTRQSYGSIQLSSNPSSVLQHRGCGEVGYKLNLQHLYPDVAEQNNLQTLVFLTRYLYGVFPEHGFPTSNRFPQLYTVQDQLSWNGCSNSEIRGTFTEDCLSGDCYDQIETNPEVLSSLLFSTDVTKFPNITKFCNEATHQRLIPNQQNLVCKGKSVMEIIPGGSEVPLIYPEVDVLRRDASQSIFFLIDRGPGMRKDDNRLWSIFRSGLATAFETTSPATRLTVRYSGSTLLNITDVAINSTEKSKWTIDVFPQSISMLTDQPLNYLARIKENIDLMKRLGFPPLVIVSGSEEAEQGDLFDEVSRFILENEIPVFVVSFSSVLGGPGLVRLTKFGGYFSVPVVSETFLLGDKTWSIIIFQHILNKISGRGSVFKLGSIPASRFNSTLELILTRAETQRPGRIIFLAPSRANYITVQSPANQNYSTSDSIHAVWDGTIPARILGVSGGVETEGSWLLTVNTDHPQNAGVDVLYTTETTEPIPTIWHQFSLAPDAVNGSTVQAVTVYGLDPGNDTVNQVNIGLPHIIDTETIAMHDDGLLTPDVTSSDGINSGFIYNLHREGNYHVWMETRKEENRGLTMTYYDISTSIYVSQAVLEEDDIIPPARITDLIVVNPFNYNDKKVTFRFTEPGDDNFDNGVAQMYYIHCGESAEMLSFQLCSSIRGRVRLPVKPRAFKEVTLKIETFNSSVYVGIVAQDRSGNLGEMSNVVEVFAPWLWTTSTSEEGTTVTSTTESGVTQADDYITKAMFWSVVGVLAALLVLLLLGVLVFVLCWQCRKKREKKEFKEGELDLQTLQQRREKEKIEDLSVDMVPPQTRSLERPKTKTNGSLKDREVAYVNTSSEGEILSAGRRKKNPKQKSRTRPEQSEPVHSISQIINQSRNDQVAGIQDYSRPGIQSDYSLPIDFRSGESTEHGRFGVPKNTSYSLNLPPRTRQGPPTLPKFGIRRERYAYPEPVQTVHQSQPSDYLVYLNNNRLPAIYSNEPHAPAYSQSSPDLIKSMDTKGKTPFNYILQSQAMAENSPKDNRPRNISFV